MLNRLAIWALNTVALMLVPEVVTSITVSSWTAALLFALLLGLVNASIKPLLLLITLPISVLTLGIFALIINALAFWAVAGLIGGIVVPTFWSAFWGALLYSVLCTLVSMAVSEPRR
ncbi:MULTISPECIES: phage holin family protein [Niveibacterium]|uniref:Phage holin family protein n=1 Tax=Niveibacterium microcysteis TaxID=2811415 RepID=A0ABX7M3V7_9RHOO|nr:MULTISPECIES: phage holin family protein [Niveibacterium]QSI75394.1 phage holin family protein [Niveibacterium microcysteis]